MSSTAKPTTMRQVLPNDFLATPYDECNVFQSRSTELVIFSLTAGEFVTIAWPTQHGRRIVPYGIKMWLRNRGLHWPCFCSLTSGNSESTRIVETLSGSTFALCHKEASKCGFRMDLTQLYESAVLESDYSHLPLLSTGNVPDMEILHSRFRGTCHSLPGPYFIGFCGESQSRYPSVIQLAGTPGQGLLQTSNPQSRHRERLNEESRRFRANISVPPPTSRAFTRIRGRMNAGLTPSMARPTRLSLGLPSEREQDTIERLQAGEGIPEFDMCGVFEKCTTCGAFFVASLLRIHIRGCSLDI